MYPELEQYLRMKRKYRSSSDPRHSELTATLIAAFVTFGCACFFALFAMPEKQPLTKVSLAPAPAPRPSLEPPAARPAIDPIEKFRAVPRSWASVDFKNYAFGPYKFADGKQRSLILRNGEYQYDLGENGRGWFSLNDVYYFDAIGGDSIPDAIVDLIHVECGGGSCDGGAHILLIYDKNFYGRVKQQFRLETGSYAYGCGLKSVTLGRNDVKVELFGHCEEPAMSDVGEAKFFIKDRTQLAYRFTDKGFIQTTTEFIKTDFTDVMNYKAELHFAEEPANSNHP